MMDKNTERAILSHLLSDPNCLKSLEENEFEKDEITQIIKYANDLNDEFPELIGRFYDWFEGVFDDAETKVLWIGWDSAGWGSGGNGVIRFDAAFGIVKMTSSDYEDDHIEIFNKKDFYPWCIESLNNDYIDMESDIYSDEELLSLARRMGMGENTKLTINGKEIEK